MRIYTMLYYKIFYDLSTKIMKYLKIIYVKYDLYECISHTQQSIIYLCLRYSFITENNSLILTTYIIIIYGYFF